jgi:hypothetical protein
MDVQRIDLDRARADLRYARAWLVCAYDSAEKCRQIAIPGAIDLDELRAREVEIPREAEIVFYCA